MTHNQKVNCTSSMRSMLLMPRPHSEWELPFQQLLAIQCHQVRALLSEFTKDQCVFLFQSTNNGVFHSPYLALYCWAGSMGIMPAFCHCASCMLANRFRMQCSAMRRVVGSICRYKSARIRNQFISNLQTSISCSPTAFKTGTVQELNFEVFQISGEVLST